MAPPVMLINHSGYAISYWHKSTTPYWASEGNRAGVLYHDDLTIMQENPTDDGWNTINILIPFYEYGWFMSPDYWMYNFGTGTPAAFESPFGEYRTVYLPEIGEYRSGQVFQVRRHSRVWAYFGSSGFQVFDGVDPGDEVMIYDGKQVTGLDENVCIRAYSKNGQWYFGSDYGQVSCDTDYELDNHNNNTMTIYANNWE